jgi:hypothetical protein
MTLGTILLALLLAPIVIVAGIIVLWLITAVVTFMIWLACQFID